LPGRGLLTVACLVLIALVCVSIVRTLERERRLLRKLKAQAAVDVQSAVSLDRLTLDERDSAQSLAKAGVLTILHSRCYITSPTELHRFNRKRGRLGLWGGLCALLVAIVIAAVMLGR
jgi:hypothetical protein